MIGKCRGATSQSAPHKGLGHGIRTHDDKKAISFWGGKKLDNLQIWVLPVSSPPPHTFSSSRSCIPFHILPSPLSDDLTGTWWRVGCVVWILVSAKWSCVLLYDAVWCADVLLCELFCRTAYRETKLYRMISCLILSNVIMNSAGIDPGPLDWQSLLLSRSYFVLLFQQRIRLYLRGGGSPLTLAVPRWQDRS